MAMPKADHTEDRRRTIRVKRAALLRGNLDQIDRPSIKIAETRDELEQAFSLVYNEYLSEGYIKDPDRSGLHFSIYHILPETVVFVFKSYLKVISTLTLIFDSETFGLPMDVLYRKELDALRRHRKRRLVELSSLATAKDARWHNLFMYLNRALVWYAMYRNATDLCIMVNPKHVDFYKLILLFKDLGPLQYYSKVSAPAVALRLDLDDVHDKFRETYSALDFDCDLHSFFFNVTTTQVASVDGKDLIVKKHRTLDIDTVRYFFIEKKNILKTATPEQMDYVRSIYPEL
jgi:hypothetical protein